FLTYPKKEGLSPLEVVLERRYGYSLAAYPPEITKKVGELIDKGKIKTNDLKELYKINPSLPSILLTGGEIKNPEARKSLIEMLRHDQSNQITLIINNGKITEPEEIELLAKCCCESRNRENKEGLSDTILHMVESFSENVQFKVITNP